MVRVDLESWLQKSPRAPLVMGVLNVTPDSFSDGGRFLAVEQAVEHGVKMAEAGASIIDVGGESTRPGADAVSEAEQTARVVPVIEGLRALGVTISIDTTRAVVARAAIDAGASLINDVSAGRDDPDMLHLASQRGAAVVLMHMQGTPRTMQVAPRYQDVVAEDRSFLLERAESAIRAGVAPHRVLLDVGIGFGKSLEHNLQLLRAYGAFAGLGHPTVLGVSRKRFVGELTGRTDPNDRLMGTAAAVAAGVLRGADVLRVHDVGAMLDVVRVATALSDEVRHA
jgi:dihydropteroate synthase